ncbi:hypothetical protein ABGB09_26200 [Streptomyces sp. B8F3]
MSSWPPSAADFPGVRSPSPGPECPRYDAVHGIRLARARRSRRGTEPAIRHGRLPRGSPGGRKRHGHRRVPEIERRGGLSRPARSPAGVPRRGRTGSR